MSRSKPGRNTVSDPDEPNSFPFRCGRHEGGYCGSGGTFPDWPAEPKIQVGPNKRREEYHNACETPESFIIHSETQGVCTSASPRFHAGKMSPECHLP